MTKIRTLTVGDDAVTQLTSDDRDGRGIRVRIENLGDPEEGGEPLPIATSGDALVFEGTEDVYLLAPGAAIELEIGVGDSGDHLYSKYADESSKSCDVVVIETSPLL